MKKAIMALVVCTGLVFPTTVHAAELSGNFSHLLTVTLQEQNVGFKIYAGVVESSLGTALLAAILIAGLTALVVWLLRAGGRANQHRRSETTIICSKHL